MRSAGLSILILFFTLLSEAGPFNGGVVTVRISWPKELIKKVIPLGTAVTIAHESLEQPIFAVFLGRYTSEFGAEKDAIGFFQPSTNEFHYLSPSKTKIIDQAGETIAWGRLKRFVQPLKQSGETCAGYTLYNYLHQISLNKNSPQVLRDRFKSTESRARMIEKTIFEMYKDTDHGLKNALADLSEENNLNLTNLTDWRGDPERTFESVLDELSRGWSVIFRFDVRASMSPHSITLVDERPTDFGSQIPYIWLPLREQDENSHRGAHAVVALGAFQVGAQIYILVSDPNFDLPRLWKSEYFVEASREADLKAWVLSYSSLKSLR